MHRNEEGLDEWGSLVHTVLQTDSEIRDLEFPIAKTYENEEGYLLILEAPEYEEEDFEVLYKNGILRVSGWRLIQGKVPTLSALFSNASEQEVFRKTFQFPAPVRADAIRIRVEGGVLRVWLPKLRDESDEAEEHRGNERPEKGI